MLAKLKKSSIIIILFFLSLLSLWSIFQRGFWTNHDQLSVIRLLELGKCFADGQIPCRWSSDLGGGFGLPLFNFYAPGFYLLAYIPRILGLSLVLSLKLTIVCLTIFSAFSMFALLREFLEEGPSLLGATLFLFLPFRALEIFVRGDFAEITAILIAPFVFWSFYRLAKDRSWLFFLTSVLSLTALLLSHNIQTVIFLPLLLIWLGYWFFKELGKRELALAFFLGLGLASFFLIPAWFEKDLVKVENLTKGYFDFRAHFIGLRQLFFERIWGYGNSVFGSQDELSFQLGWPHWWLVPFALAMGLPLAIFLVWVIAIFLMTNHSLFIWEKIALLHFFQFPWRLLGLAGFLTAVLSAIGLQQVWNLLKRIKLWLFLLLVISTVILNVGYFKPKDKLFIDDGKIKGEFLSEQRWASALDYLPREVKVIPEFDSTPYFTSLKTQVNNFFKKSDYFEVNVEVYEKSEKELIIPIFNFPQWQVFVDQKKVDLIPNEWGLLMIKVGEGQHLISGWFRDTTLRELANLISLVSLAGLFFIVINWEIFRKLP